LILFHRRFASPSFCFTVMGVPKTDRSVDHRDQNLPSRLRRERIRE
jgi:hypothetical protein